MVYCLNPRPRFLMGLILEIFLGLFQHEPVMVLSGVKFFFKEKSLFQKQIFGFFAIYPVAKRRSERLFILGPFHERHPPSRL